MAASRLDELNRVFERLRALAEKAKLGETRQEFAAPTFHSVVWVVLDQRDTDNRREALAQTAFRAHELSGITRDDRCLAYGECHVYYSERLTKKLADAVADGLSKLCQSSSPKKLNGKANGHAG